MLNRRTLLTSTPALALAIAAPVAATPAPERRIAAAMAEIQLALKELHPEWSVQEPKQDIHHCMRTVNGGLKKGEAYSHTILFYAYDGMHGSQEARWFRGYL